MQSFIHAPFTTTTICDKETFLQDLLITSEVDASENLGRNVSLFTTWKNLQPHAIMIPLVKRLRTF